MALRSNNMSSNRFCLRKSNRFFSSYAGVSHSRFSKSVPMAFSHILESFVESFITKEHKVPYTSCSFDFALVFFGGAGSVKSRMYSKVVPIVI